MRKWRPSAAEHDESTEGESNSEASALKTKTLNRLLKWKLSRWIDNYLSVCDYKQLLPHYTE